MKRVALIILSISILTLHSQEKGTFRGYLSSGFTLNQMSGDSTSGFNYWGYTGGVGTYFHLTKSVSANLELNYAMRGASGFVFDENGDYLYHRTIHTNYIEIPIMVNYHDHKIARFGGGLVVSSLMNTTQWYDKKSVSNERIDNYYKPFDIGFIVSIAFDIKKHFGFNLRMIHSILPTNKIKEAEDQYHVTLSARGLYYF